MRFFTTALALAAVPAAVLAATQTVTVGDQGQLMFNPQTITAAAGDTINFEFRAKNHSVTQSTFAAPCTKGMFNGSPGVSAGFLAVPKDVQNGSFPTWSITIKNDKPLWFFCGQKIPANHCQAGMVFSINPAADKTHDMFVAAAKASVNDPAPDPAASGSAGAAPAGSAPQSGSTSTPSGTAPSGTEASGGDPASASAGGVAGAAAGTAASSSSTNTPAADNSAQTSGASRRARGTAGLFAAAAVVGAVLL